MPTEIHNFIYYSAEGGFKANQASQEFIQMHCNDQFLHKAINRGVLDICRLKGVCYWWVLDVDGGWWFCFLRKGQNKGV